MLFSTTEIFVARRMTHTANGTSPRRSVMQRVATLAVAMSLVVMIVTLAIIFGFKREVHRKITALSGSVVVTTMRGVSTSAEDYLIGSAQLDSLVRAAGESRGVSVEQLSGVVVRAAVARGGSMVDGVVLKGVDSTYDMRLFADGLIAGEIPQFGHQGNPAGRNVIISNELATQMQLEVGGRLELLLSEGDGQQMRRDLYRVGAIYAAGLGSAERGVVVADVANLRRLNSWHEGQISAIEISIDQLDRAPEVADDINQAILFGDTDMGDNAAAFAIQQLNPAIFDWLAAHDINGVVVVAIMLVVAIFNIVTALMIMVMERSRMIGTLKALGMSSRSIGRLFVIRALSITLRGMAWGNGIGLALCWVQWRFEPLRLDEAGYMLTSVPIEFGLGWWVGINVLVVAVIFVSVLLPARLVSSIEPHRAIKFQ